MKPGDARPYALHWVRWLCVLVAATAVSGCVNSPAFKDDYELQSLLSEYEWRTAQIENERQQKVGASIKRLEVTNGYKCGRLGKIGSGTS